MSPEQMGWRQAFRDEDTLPPSATGAAKAKRGRTLEKILSGMFEESGLEPRLSYRPKGEEVDGSIWLDGRAVLVEAKWTSEPHPASSIYQFKGKVDGKLTGTIGLFISMAGFSNLAVDALVSGKEVNIVLADGDDIRAVVDGRVSMIDALRHKLRAAGDTGTPFFPLAALLPDPFTTHLGTASSQTGRHIVFVEGRSDVRYLEFLRRRFDATSEVTIIPTAGTMNMSPLIRSVLETSDRVTQATVVVDGDAGDRVIEKLRQDLTRLTSDLVVDFQVMVMEPNLETALGLSREDSYRTSSATSSKTADERLDSTVSPTELRNRSESNPVLRSLLIALGVFLGSR